MLKGVFAQHKIMERLILRIMKLQLKVKSKHTVAIFKLLVFYKEKMLTAKPRRPVAKIFRKFIIGDIITVP